MNRHKRPHQQNCLSRRGFLRTLLASAGSVAVAACGPVRGGDFARRVALAPGAAPPVVLPSPVPEGGTPTPPVDEQLAAFLALSSLLTGVDDLDPHLGRVYMQSLSGPDTAAASNGMTTTALLQQAGFLGATGAGDADPPATLEELEATGVLAQAGAAELARSVTTMWYTGIYTDASGGETVATYVDALAWKTLQFTKPKTICGYPGFWAEAWPVTRAPRSVRQ